MGKALYSGLATLVLAFIAVPAWGQKGGGGHARAMGGGGGPVMMQSHASAATQSAAHGTARTTGKARTDSDADLHGGRSSKSHKHLKKTNTRSNKGGTMRGKERAEEVQGLNTKADDKRGFTTSKGLENAETKKAVTTQNSTSAAAKTKQH